MLLPFPKNLEMSGSNISGGNTHTSDIFFGIVMITEYPLSVVFSAHPPQSV
jgi:hypothetical protein